jgi:hypothetical protein
MRMVTKSSKRMALLFAIFLAVFSTGVVIAHQCNSMSSNQVTTQLNHSDYGSALTTVTKTLNVASNTDRLIDTGCAALFIVVLLFGRNFLDLRAPRSHLNNFMNSIRDLSAVYRPQVFHIALSRPQLGVIRI